MKEMYKTKTTFGLVIVGMLLITLLNVRLEIYDAEGINVVQVSGTHRGVYIGDNFKGISCDVPFSRCSVDCWSYNKSSVKFDIKEEYIGLYGFGNCMIKTTYKSIRLAWL